MAIDYANLFSTLGKLGKCHHDAQAFAAGTLLTDLTAAQVALGVHYDALAALSQQIASGQAGAMQVAPALRQAAGAVLCAYVNADVPLPDPNSVPLALAELIRQMVADGESVPQCAVTATAAAASGNAGNGVCVLTALRGDGLRHANLFAEVGDLTCTGDAQSGGGTAGQEPFRYAGDPAASDPLGWDWPKGSGASANLQTVDSQQSNLGNLLTNSDFEAFTTANVPDNWVIATGAAGTDVFSEGSIVYRGSKALRLAGGATLTALTQAFNATAGTPAVLRPQTSYGFAVRLKVDVVPAAGVLSVQLTNDAQGVANSVAVSLPGLSTSYAATTGVFRMPKVIPATGLKLQLKLTTALSAGSNLYADSLALAYLTPLYAAGPAAAVFAGSTPFVAGDRFVLTMTNDRAGTTYATTWQSVFQRWFNMTQLNLVLPASGSPTRADSLLA
jgi:hypothetical protein